MKPSEKATRIVSILDELYADAPIPLDHTDPFTLLVAVVLSAQTTDARVNLVTPALFARGPTPEAMARIPVEEILALIRTCGLAPAKAKNVSALSKLLVERHGGRVPRTFEELEALPGVGHKTASVVMAQAFGVAAFPVDTHIHRLAQRWGLSDGSSVERTERDLKALFPESTWIRMHLAIILFGREHCPALRHDMSRCPICSWAADRALVAASASASERRDVARAAKPVANSSHVRKTRAAASPTAKSDVASLRATKTNGKIARGTTRRASVRDVTSKPPMSSKPPISSRPPTSSKPVRSAKRAKRT